MGLAYQNAEQYEEALPCYEVAIRLKPDYAMAHCNRGAVLIELERYDEGVEASKNAIRLQPNLVEPYYNVASAYFCLGRYTEAIDNCNKLIRIEPDHPCASRLLAANEKIPAGLRRSAGLPLKENQQAR
jgi:tetratricopeptide (TPR) repeat protein